MYFSTSSGRPNGDRSSAYHGTPRACTAISRAAMPPIPKISREAEPSAMNSPSARHKNGYAGRIYVGSLLPEQEKNKTHQPPAISQNPPARDGPALSNRSPNRLRKYGTNSSVPGSIPTRMIGA